MTIGIEDVRIKFKNHKCFGKNLIELNSIKPINIIIGRNNSGKSSIIDLIGYLIEPGFFKAVPHKGSNTELYYTLPLIEEDLKKVFIDNWNIGNRLLGGEITFLHIGKHEKNIIDINPSFGKQALEKWGSALKQIIKLPLENCVFIRLKAERDIVAETRAGDINFKIGENGADSTRILEIFINELSYEREKVTQILLSELNKIVEPDSHFDEIQVRRSRDTWQIVLVESNKGPIPLSNSGSGLKTILLVLINILLVPRRTNYKIENYIYAFEELENSLHPALQRKLLSYIRSIALKTHAHFFITTHSNVVIDLFDKDDNAQIFHVTHDGTEANIVPVKTYIGKSAILNDLDIRASDLLQSNGIIWVEGPSDRIYINKWIELWSGETLQEGAHYQCLFYGGRLLRHLSANPPEEEQRNLIKILQANRNAAILLDSDKKTDTTKINDTKLRLCQEIKKINGMYWITSGRVIETYIPKSAISKYYSKNVENEIGQYDKFEDYIDTIEVGKGDVFNANKVKFAEEIIQYLTLDNLKVRLDLDSKMIGLVNIIKKWNNLD